MNLKQIPKQILAIWPDAIFLESEGANSLLFRVPDDSGDHAVKMLRHPEKFERFKREVLAMEKLEGCEGIARIFESSLDDPKCAYFVMPWYEGGSLKVQVPSFRQRSPEGTAAVELMLKVAEAVREVHVRGLAHRDLKPDNILLDAGGNPAISDFGLCLDLDEDPDTRLSRVSEIVGAIAYRAPEFLRGRLDSSDHRPGDIFSLGRILWAMVTGREPYQMTDTEFDDAKLSGLAAETRRVQLLEELVAAATHVDPARRVSIDGLISYLEEWRKEYAPGSTGAILAGLRESQNRKVRIANARMAQSVQEDKERLLSLLRAELQNLLNQAGWAEMTAVVGGNQVAVLGQPYIGEQEHLHKFFPSALHNEVTDEGLSCQLNLGDMSLAPMLNFSLALKTDLNRRDGQLGEIIGKNTLRAEPGQNEYSYEFLGPWSWSFSYDDPDVAIVWVREMTVCFHWLDKKLRDQIVY